MWIHVHGLGAIAPAGRDGERDANAFSFELLGAARGLGHAADSRIGDDALDVAEQSLLALLTGVGSCVVSGEESCEGGRRDGKHESTALRTGSHVDPDLLSLPCCLGS